MQSLNTDFANICISPRPSGALWGTFSLQVVKKFDTRLDKISVPSISQLPLSKLSLSVN